MPEDVVVIKARICVQDSAISERFLEERPADEVGRYPSRVGGGWTK
jgi:hypothetical protein